MIAVVSALRAAFLAHADPDRAAPMQAYMKSTLPFHGIPAPLRRTLQNDAVRAHPCGSRDEVATAMRTLLREARAREEWYAAAELARIGIHRPMMDIDLLPVFEEIITTTAWWDVCDEVSGASLPRLLESDPGAVSETLRRWARGDDLWLRRAAIVAQRRRDPVDVELLYDCIEPSLEDSRFHREFFITKAIGWALRERSYHRPDEVVAFCERESDRLAPLTVREALRAIRRNGARSVSR